MLASRITLVQSSPGLSVCLSVLLGGGRLELVCSGPSGSSLLCGWLVDAFAASDINFYIDLERITCNIGTPYNLHLILINEMG